MEIRIQIECETIQQFWQHLDELQKQVKRSAKKQKLNPIEDEFQPEDSDSFDDDNCYGTHYVTIQNDGDTEEAQKHAEELHDACVWGMKKMRDLIMSKDIKTISEWQLCPMCFGEGICDNIGTLTSVKRTCPVCNGNRTLIKPII